MSERVDYCKRLIKKFIIIHDNLGENEAEEMNEYLEKMDERHQEDSFLVDDATPCECAVRTDVVAFNKKKYCCDCLHYVEEKKDDNS